MWFVAASPTGPWSVATSVPAVIYSIPPSSPLHYVTYAQVYGSTPDTVDVGYTPGYLGTEVSPDGVVVYGTGYDYPPYIGNSWIGSPYTYGFGVGFADNWDVGFGFGFGAGCWLGTWCHPWWGPFAWGRHHHFDYTHVSLNHIDIYHHWAPGVVHVEHNYGFNAWNGRQWSHTWSTHFNPYSSRAANLSPVRQTRAYDGNFRSRAPQPTGPPRTTYSFNNNVYAGRDGNVYRYNPSGSWERNTGQAWHPAPQVPRMEQQQLEIGRSMGEQRFNNYRSYGGGFSHPAPAFGGGHFGGGGHR